MTKIEEAVIGWWGPRCTTFEEDCPCCQAWAEYDASQAKVAAANILAEMVDGYLDGVVSAVKVIAALADYKGGCK